MLGSELAAAAHADRVLMGEPAPDPVRAVSLYRAAAEGGSALAHRRLSVMLAGGLGCTQDWPAALDAAASAAELGDVEAQHELSLLAGGRRAADWRALAMGIDLDALLTPAKLDRLSTVSVVGAARGFAPPGFSAWLIEKARARLQPSVVNDSATGAVAQHQMRTATVAAFGPLDRDLVVAVMQTRAARLANLPEAHHEAPNVISYEPGQRFDLHVDYVDPSIAGFKSELEAIGQRVITFVTYLNDDFEGAATHFPKLGIDFRGHTGDAIVFSNVHPDGRPDPNTLHAGLPPVRGRKWVLSQWLRGKPMLLR